MKQPATNTNTYTSKHKNSPLFIGNKTDFTYAYPAVAARIFNTYTTTPTKKNTTKVTQSNTIKPIEQIIYFAQNGIHDTIIHLDTLLKQKHTSPLYSPNNCLSITTDQQAAMCDTPIHETIMVIVDTGTSVQLADSLNSHHTNHTHINRSITYWVDDYAHLTLFYNQGLPASIKEHTQIECYAGKQSIINITCLITGGSTSTTTLNLYAHKEYAQLTVKGAYILHNNQQAHISILQKHTAAHTHSNVHIKGVLADQAYMLYQGLIYIDTDAHHTDAMQNNKNILLNSGAQARSIPSLEILTNEVRCAHGSAIGSIDANLLFYMQSRGLPLGEASHLLVQGFIAELFEGSAYIQAQDHLKKILS